MGQVWFFSLETFFIVTSEVGKCFWDLLVEARGVPKQNDLNSNVNSAELRRLSMVRRCEERM